MEFLHQLGTLDFWKTLLDGFGDLGPLAPIALAMVESFFPPLPLIAIVALNVAAHGGFLGFAYSWIGVLLGGTLMFLFWRRVVKRFFWKVASRSEKLEKAQRWVSRLDVASLFMLSVLPFAPSSFMHFAFGISDFDEKRYLITMLLGKGAMVAMMALFGQSIVSSLKNPVYPRGAWAAQRSAAYAGRLPQGRSLRLRPPRGSGSCWGWRGPDWPAPVSPARRW